MPKEYKESVREISAYIFEDYEEVEKEKNLSLLRKLNVLILAARHCYVNNEKRLEHEERGKQPSQES